MATVHEARDARRSLKASLDHQQKAQIVALGISLDPENREQYVITIHVKDDPSLFPKEIDGVKINSATTAELQAQY